MGLVYSTDGGGRICPACRHAMPACRCRVGSAPPAPGPVRVQRSSRGRGGKTVTVVNGLALADAELQALGKALRSACGSGGTVKDGAIEVQGDHVERVLAALAGAGIAAKRSGG